MEHIFQAAADYFVITMIGGCFMLGILLKSATVVITTASRERSRREIAAYIAEGSLTPEQGERLMRADVNSLANRAA